MAMLFLFATFWIGVVSVVAAAGAPLADLFRRENPVRWWFGLPLVPVFAMLGFLPVIFMDHTTLGWRVIENCAFVLACFHFFMAGALLFLGVSLAVVRGLRPGGATSRRVRTSLMASLVLALLGVQPVLLGLVDEGWGLLTSWLALACMAGMIWIWTVNRRGPWRLTEGKRTSASLLLASMLQLGLATAHMAFVLRLGYPNDWAMFTTKAWVLITPVLLLLPLGLRFLSGPLPTAPLIMSGALGSTLLVPPLLLLSWRPWPGELPTWTNLVGEPGPQVGISRQIVCPRSPHDPTPCNSPWSSIHTAARPSTPLDQLPIDADLLIGDGRRRVHNEWAHGDAELLVEVNGLARLGQNPPVPLGPELHRMLQNLGNLALPLEVERTTAWTAQDYVSICASYRWSCRLK